MIQSIEIRGRSSTAKKNLRIIITMCLIAISHGRNINDLRETSELRNNGANGMDDLHSRNQAKNYEARDPRLSELEWSTYSIREPNGPGTFAFGYDNVIDSVGNEHYRSEERFDNGTVIGEYGYTDNSINRKVRVTYVADNRGYRAKTEFLPMADLFSRNGI